MDRFFLQAPAIKSSTFNFRAAGEDTARRIAFFIVHGGILLATSVSRWHRQICALSPRRFSRHGSCSARAEALANAVRFREDLVKARRKSRRDRNGSVGGFAHHSA